MVVFIIYLQEIIIIINSFYEFMEHDVVAPMAATKTSIPQLRKTGTFDALIGIATRLQKTAGYAETFASIHPMASAAGCIKFFWKRLVVVGNLKDTGHDDRSREMRNIGVLTGSSGRPIQGEPPPWCRVGRSLILELKVGALLFF
jgi:hypothetical protein